MVHRIVTLVVAMGLAVLAASPLHAQEGEGSGQVKWFENHEEAAAAAKEQGKLLVVDLYTDWCGWCKKLEEDTYPAPEVQDVLKKYVPLKINPEKVAFGKELMEKAGAKGFPATVVADADWKVLHFISGYKAAKPYAEELGGVLRYFELKPKFEGGEMDYAGLVAFAKSAKIMGKKDELRAAGEKALAAQETGEHHAELAFLVGTSFENGSAEFASYRETVAKYDPENDKGYYDDYVVADAVAIMRSIKSQEQHDIEIPKARKLLEDRIAQESPKMSAEKRQLFYGYLFDWYYLRGKGDKEKAVEMLKRGVEAAPESDMGKRMADILAKITG